MHLIALEEHFAWDPVSDGNEVAGWLRTHNQLGYDRLYDRGPLRLEQMDAAGIDFQILSLFDPGVQEYTDTALAVDYARRANDNVAETVRQYPPIDSAPSRRWPPRIRMPQPSSCAAQSPTSASPVR